MGTQSYGCTPAGRGFDTSMGFMDGAEDHWTQASCFGNCSCNCPTEASTAMDAMMAAGLGARSTMDMWCTDAPCYNRTGNEFRLGRNGCPVGDPKYYGDYQYSPPPPVLSSSSCRMSDGSSRCRRYSQEAMRIISEHDTTIPLFYYIAFQNNHEPLEAPDEYIELYPSSWRQDRRWCKPHTLCSTL